ncbi:MAG: 30S ribosome-binding factor RbfA [bacterium]|nr:30S ribosome-binding factor RbfA [bacterium]MDZ4231917.1 30S ribosome-binding factor RbfA [Candidatus Pacearchaeota archaeon]
MRDRILSIQEILREEISKILLHELDLSRGVLATLTRVEASGNLQQAKVYISVIPETESKQVFSQLKHGIFAIQQKLNKKLRMRPVPKIIWMAETKTKEAARIEELLEENR